MKTLKMVWIYAWAYFFVALELIDKVAKWAEHQIDHNDYLAGALIVTSAIILSWMLGIVQIVWMG